MKHSRGYRLGYYVLGPLLFLAAVAAVVAVGVAVISGAWWLFSRAVGLA